MKRSSNRESDHEIIVDTGKCRVERHPVFGVVIRGGLIAMELDGAIVVIPLR